MKTATLRSATLTLALGLATGIPVPAVGAPVGTGFIFQGELVENGVPLTGTAHLRFGLYDSPGSGSPPVGGSVLGAPQLIPDVPVSNGVFSVVLDDAGQFGPSAFNGDARWIQLEVCDDASCTTFTTLGPRQPVTATPYARFSAAPWETVAGNTVLPGGSVGIGTVAPEASLHILGGDILAGANGSEWLFHTRSQANGDFLRITDLDGGVVQFQRGLVLTEAGNLGVGTGFSPVTARLDVRGDIKLGAGGEYFASGGEESLRIVRGEVAGDGSAPVGCCFSCVRVSTGVYDITLANAFTGAPTITVTPRSAGITASTVWLGNNGSFRVLTYLDGAGSNSAFHFIAMGPH